MIQETLANTKNTVVTALATIGTGTGQWFGWIPEDIGKLGVTVGALLSITMLYIHISNHIKKRNQEKEDDLERERELLHKKHKEKLEIEALRLKIASYEREKNNEQKQK